MKVHELRKILLVSQNKHLTSVVTEALTLINDNSKILSTGKVSTNSKELAKMYKIRMELTPLPKNNFIGVDETIKSLEEIDEKLKLVDVLNKDTTIALWLTSKNEVKGCFIQIFKNGTKEYEKYFDNPGSYESL